MRPAAGIDVQGARALVERHDGKVEHVLDDDERVALLRCYGIEMLPFRRTHSARGDHRRRERARLPRGD